MSNVATSPIPTDPDQVKRLREQLDDCTGFLRRIDSEKNNLKEAVAAISEEHGIKVADLNKQIKLRYEGTLNTEVEKTDHMVEMHEKIFGRAANDD